MREITHTNDPETGRAVQIVTPERLRQILDAAGESYERPDCLGPDDDWNVGDDEEE